MERNTVLSSQRVQQGLSNVWKEMKALRGYLFQEYDLTPASLDRMEASLNEIWTGYKNDVVAIGSIPGVMDRVYDLKRRNADLQNELWEKNCITEALKEKYSELEKRCEWYGQMEVDLRMELSETKEKLQEVEYKLRSLEYGFDKSPDNMV